MPRKKTEPAVVELRKRLPFDVIGLHRQIRHLTRRARHDDATNAQARKLLADAAVLEERLVTECPHLYLCGYPGDEGLPCNDWEDAYKSWRICVVCLHEEEGDCSVRETGFETLLLRANGLMLRIAGKDVQVFRGKFERSDIESVLCSFVRDDKEGSCVYTPAHYRAMYGA